MVVLACTSTPNVEHRLDSMACFAMADPFHACGAVPAPVVSRQFHCGGLPNPHGRKSQQHAGGGLSLFIGEPCRSAAWVILSYAIIK